MSAVSQRDGDPCDAELLHAAAVDAQAFRVLYDRHATAVHRYFERRTLGRAADALDLTAETFATAWTAAGRYRSFGHTTARPWLFGIAKNVLRRSVRNGYIEQRARNRIGMLTTDAPQVPAIDSWIDGLDDDLDAALECLPVRQRVAVVMRTVDGEPYDAIAARLQCSPGAARICVSRGLTALRLQIEGENQ